MDFSTVGMGEDYPSEEKALKPTVVIAYNFTFKIMTSMNRVVPIQ